MPNLTEIGAETQVPSSCENCAPASVESRRTWLTGNETLVSKFEIITILAVGAAFAFGLLFEIGPLNGFSRWTNWHWPWRQDIDLLRALIYLAPPFAGIHFVLRRAESQSHLRVAVSLVILSLSNFLLQILGVLADPKGIELIREIVLSPTAASYFPDAARVHGVAEWLHHFDRASLGFHSSTHPPGPILFCYVFYKMFGSRTGALLAGCAEGFVGSLGVLVAYAFAGLWTDNRRARILATAFYALLPALTVFFPEMDCAYPVLSMLMIFFWCRSLEASRRIPFKALCVGAVLFVGIFFAYNLLTIGAFLAFYALYWIWRQGWTKRSWFTVLRNSAIAGAVCAGIYLVLWLATGYGPFASFWTALSNQAVYAALLHRSYLAFALTDPYDFFLGAGILALPLVLFNIRRIVRNFDLRRTDTALTLIGLATILTVDASGVLRGEAARVWLFLMPLLAVPAALEISRFQWRWVLAIFWMQWLILVCLKAKMNFVSP